MGIVRTQMSWVRDSGLSEDVVTNTWYLYDGTTNAPPAGELDDIHVSLNDFYNDLSDRFAAHLGTTRSFKMFDMEDAEPRVPIREDSFTPTAPTNQGFPGEVALCLSFQGLEESGAIMARRRGRIFLGPLAMASAATSETAGDTRPSTATITAIDTAYNELITEWAAIGAGWTHSIWSPTTFAATGDHYDSVFTAFTVWVDNAYDIQRRRGAKATTRTTIVP